MAEAKKSETLGIKDGKLLDARVTQKIFINLEHGDLKKVDALVLHQTGGKDAAGTLPEYKSSTIGAHFLIDQDGTVYQTARINKRAFHVGKSRSKCLEAKSCGPEEQAAIKTILNAKGVSYSKKLKELNDSESAKSYPTRYPNNDDSLGIEVASAMTNGTYEDPTSDQATSVKWLVAELLALLNLKASDVYRHPEVSYKDASEAQHVKF